MLGDKVIGKGNTAIVYEWEDNKVLKLFHQGYPKEAVDREYLNAMAIREMDFPKPKAYELYDKDGWTGIIYDRVMGDTLTDWVLKTEDLRKCAMYMAELHKKIIRYQVNNVPDYKEFLRRNILNSPCDNTIRQQEVLKKLDKLPNGHNLCHGDYHPGNIILSDGQPVVIDFVNICRGNYLYDVARTVFLIQYTPVPAEEVNKEMMLQFKKMLADQYLLQMDITREMIKDYIALIIEARPGELNLVK